MHRYASNLLFRPARRRSTVSKFGILIDEVLNTFLSFVWKTLFYQFFFNRFKIFSTFFRLCYFRTDNFRNDNLSRNKNIIQWRTQGKFIKKEGTRTQFKTYFLLQCQQYFSGKFNYDNNLIGELKTLNYILYKLA